MILFEKQFVDSILSESKTRTYRLWKKPRCRVGAVHQAKTDYSAGSCFARLRIISVKRVRIGNLFATDAHADGFKTLREFRQYLNFPANGYAWEVKFELVGK